MTNKELKKELLKILDISPQALSQQCKKLKKQVPMTTEDAVYIIAQRNNVILDKYLETEDINRVRDLYQQFVSSTQKPIKVTHGKTKAVLTKPKVVKIGKDIQYNAPILSTKKIAEANEMAQVYPIIYVLENSIRELINRTMAAQYGNDWWDSQVSNTLKDQVSARMTDEKKHSWHQRRGDRPIDYLDLKDLPRLMTKIENIVVPDIIPSLEWFRQFVDEVYKSRCVVCHMNPLDEDNIKAVQVRFNQWLKQINAKQHLIPK